MSRFLDRESLATDTETFENLRVKQTIAYMYWLTGETSDFKRSLAISKELSSKFFSKYGTDPSQSVNISTLRIAQNKLELLS